MRMILLLSYALSFLSRQAALHKVSEWHFLLCLSVPLSFLAYLSVQDMQCDFPLLDYFSKCNCGSNKLVSSIPIVRLRTELSCLHWWMRCFLIKHEFVVWGQVCWHLWLPSCMESLYSFLICLIFCYYIYHSLHNKFLAFEDGGVYDYGAC